MTKFIILIILHRAYQQNWAKLMTHSLGPKVELTISTCLDQGPEHSSTPDVNAIARIHDSLTFLETT